MKHEWKSYFRLGATLFLLFLAVTYWGNIAHLFVLAIGAASSLILGCVIAYVVNILMSFYEKLYFPKSEKKLVAKSRRVVCMIGAMLTLIGVLLFVIYLVIPELIACMRLLMQEIPIAMHDVAKWLHESHILSAIVEDDVTATLVSMDWQAKLAQYAKVLVEGFGGVAQAALSTVSTVLSKIMTFVIALIFSIYLLMGKERLGMQFKRLMQRYMKPSWNRKFWYVLKTMDDCFHKFIVGQCIEAVILGVLCIIAMTILKFPYAMMVGTLVGFTALIPIAGAYIGAAVGAFMIFTVSPMKAIAFLVFIVILQQLEGNLIYPKVVGTSIGLPGVWVLAAVTVGGGIFGILGMLIGVPLAAAIYKLIKEDIKKGEGTAL